MRGEVMIFLFEKVFLMFAVLMAAGGVISLVGAVVERDLGAAVGSLVVWLLSASFLGVSLAIRNRRPKFSTGKIKPVSQWI